MYSIVLTRQFKKDMKKLLNDNKLQQEVTQVIDILERGKILPSKYKNHEPKGNLTGRHECHIRPDVLLIYRYIQNELLLVLIRVGSHSKLFS